MVDTKPTPTPSGTPEPGAGQGAPVFEIEGEQVTLDQVKEWRDGQLRQADYTRKTQELADQRRQLDQYQQQLQQDLGRLLTDGQYRQELARTLGVTPRESEVASEDPILKELEDVKALQQRMWQTYQQERLNAETARYLNAITDARKRFPLATEEAILGALAKRAASITLEEIPGLVESIHKDTEKLWRQQQQAYVQQKVEATKMGAEGRGGGAPAASAASAPKTIAEATEQAVAFLEQAEREEAQG